MRVGWRWWLVAISASVAVFVLLAPITCSSALGVGVVWRCESLLGWQLPGFSGQGDTAPSYLPAIIGALIVFAGAVVLRARRPTAGCAAHSGGAAGSRSDAGPDADSSLGSEAGSDD